jgi:SnoaL-like domain
MSAERVAGTTEIAAMAEHVRVIMDRQAIVDCLHRYSRGLDRHDQEILRSVYHDDALDHHGDFTGPPDQFVPWADQLLASEWDGHTHFLDVNHVEIDGDAAHSECYVFFAQRRRDGDGVDIGGGRYLDRLERREGEWRVVARELVIEWQGRAELTWFGGGSEYPSGKWDRTDRSYERPLTIVAPGTGPVTG